jgi:hypothetical protein
MRLEDLPHSGQALSAAPARANTTMPALVSVMPSTTKPAGMKDETRNCRAMLLIPFRKQHHVATKYHRD